MSVVVTRLVPNQIKQPYSFLSIWGTLLIEEQMLVQSNLQSICNAVITIVSRSPGKLTCGNVDSRPGTGQVLM